MLTAILSRNRYTEIQTLGKMYIDGHVFRTLELPPRSNKKRISAIPPGIYTVSPRYSPKFGDHFHVKDVIGRAYILIHSGNTYHDTVGCIIIGSRFKDINGDNIDDVIESRNSIALLRKIAPEGFTLEIW